MLSHVYSKSFIQNSPVLQKITGRLLYERFLPQVARLAGAASLATIKNKEGVREDHQEGLQGQDLLQTDSKPTNVLNLFSAITMDLVSAYQFGLVNGTRMSGQEERCDDPIESAANIGYEEFFELYRSRHAYTFWPQEHPRLTRLLSHFGVRLVPRFVDEANAKIEDMTMRMCDAAAATTAASCANAEIASDNEKYNVSGERMSDPIEDIPVVYNQLSKSLARNDVDPDNVQKQSLTSNDHGSRETVRYRRQQIASELLDHLAAGFETSGITLTYAAYELSRKPETQIQLRNELRSLDSSPLTSYFTNDFFGAKVKTSPTTAEALPIPDAKQIDNLPLLHAILLETLRLYSAVPGPQPRITPTAPSSTAVPSTSYGKSKTKSPLSTSTILSGHDGVPGGTRVSAQAYSLHRNAAVFPDPESWQPMRWLSVIVDSQGTQRLQLRGSRGKKNNSNQKSEDPADEMKTDDGVEDVAIKEMYRWFWAFGSGGRMCIGSNLAMYRKCVVPLSASSPTQISPATILTRQTQKLHLSLIKSKNNRNEVHSRSLVRQLLIVDCRRHGHQAEGQLRSNTREREADALFSQRGVTWTISPWEISLFSLSLTPTYFS